MNDKDLYWLAGLLEGEGSFLKPSPSASQNAIRISVQMTDEDIIKRVSELFGRKYYSYTDKRGKWKTVYVVIVTHKKAADIMRQIYSIMGERRKSQIDAALNGYEEPTRHQFTEEQIRDIKFSGKSYRTLAKEYGVSRSTIGRVKVL